MKIIQLLTHLNWGDAISNDVLAIDDTLRAAGYESEIMALKINERLKSRAKAVDFSSLRPEDILLFHKASGDELMRHVVRLPCRKGMIYHNITPARFFLPYDAVMAWHLNRGRRQLRKYAAGMDFAWGDSGYNCRELRKAGAKNVSVRPVFFDSLRPDPDPTVLKGLRQEAGTKILFIGRIAPNKKQEDLIKAYDIYRNRFDSQARLYLVGGWEGTEKYYAKLKGFAAELKLSDDQVIFTGRVTDGEKEAYLRGADVFLCLSEHEGFCVPLLEAMARDLPVVACARAAVPETLGENGLLVSGKNEEHIAGRMHRVRTDPSFRSEVLSRQRKSLERFRREKTEQRLLQLIGEAGA